MVYLIAAFVVALLSVIFALQNSFIVEVRFLFWQLEASLALIILVSFGLGAIGTLAFMVPRVITARMGERRKEKEVGELEADLAKQLTSDIVGQSDSSSDEISDGSTSSSS